MDISANCANVCLYDLYNSVDLKGANQGQQKQPEPVLNPKWHPGERKKNCCKDVSGTKKTHGHILRSASAKKQR